MYLSRNILILFALTMWATSSFSQSSELIVKFDQYRKSNYQEKLYITTDREFYITGEILWFKIYNIEGSGHRLSDLSKVAYVELIGNDSVPRLQAKIKLENGMGKGSFYLPTTLSSGSYTLRGYTNWMKNYDAAFYFQKDISIVNTFKNSALTLTSKELYLDFFPEGGHLVEGIENRIAFQGVGKNGLGASFQAWMLNQDNDTLQEFSPVHNGMGYFDFIPEENEVYKVVARLDHDNHYFSLPEISKNGYSLRLEEIGEGISVYIKTRETDSDLTLLVHSRGMVSAVEKKYTQNGTTSFLVTKDQLNDGINHITLFNRFNQPVCERLFFKYPAEINKVDFVENIAAFRQNEKVSFRLKTNFDSNISVSVFKLDSLNNYPRTDIISYLYLSSDLKGKIESPGYYFQNQKGLDQIDLVMLTHGWSRFSWNDIITAETKFKKYVPEYRGLLVTGKVVDRTNRQTVEGVYSYLSVTDGDPRFLNSRSDQLGKVKFELIDFYGSRNIYLGFDYTNDSVYNLELNNPFSNEYFYRGSSGLVLDESIEDNLIERGIAMQTLNLLHQKKRNQFIEKVSDTVLFFDKGNQTYKLDDYTRFTTMEDVMREYVPNVWVRKKDNSFYYRIMDVEKDIVYKKSPLVLYDGLPVFEVDEIMDVDPLKVKRLDVVSTRYFFGKQTYDGVVSYLSYKGGTDGYTLDPSVLMVEYEGYQKERIFYSPSLEDVQNKNLPNKRNLLYWNPEVETFRDSEKEISFYSADEGGKYLIVAEGLSIEGMPCFATKTFTVD